MSVSGKMPLRAWACLLFQAVLSNSVASMPNESSWQIAIYGPMTSVSQQFLAGAAAFDIDFRKHFEPDLIERLGPPVIEIPRLNPALHGKLGIVIGTSNSDAEVGAKTALHWLLGNASLPPVVAIVGGYHSSVAARVAALVATFEIPQIAFGATSPSLSDKLLYPYTLRTIPPDTIQGLAMWAWMQHFSVHSASFVYAQEPYGLGLLTALQTAAGTQQFRIMGLALPFMPNPDEYRLDAALNALQGIKDSGTRFVLMALTGNEAIVALYLLEQEGLLGGNGGYQVLGAESVFPLDFGLFQPSHSSLVGFQKFYPAAVGPLWDRFERLWTQLSPSDLYSEEARERYGLHNMRIRLEDGAAPALTADDFASFSSSEPGVHMFAALLFDAAYTVVLAMNELLNQGIDPGRANSAALLEQMGSSVFEGVTGSVGFDSQGDRDGQFQLWNLQQNSSSSSAALQWALLGLYTSESGGLSFSVEPVWATGESSSTVPPSLLACPSGFQRESASNLCEKCRPGIGCGFRIEDGFPIGIYGPITSLSQEILGMAVLFDLDFRKNVEPALQERFGPPIVHIPNLHPDLKIKVQVGTSDSQVNVGVETTLHWFGGAGDFYRVAGVVGGYHSAIAGPVSSNAQVFEVPHIGWGASSPSLSDKTLYPWFSRTNPPDSLLGAALWAWMQHFGVPSVTVVYSREPFGEGLFQAIADLATESGQGGRVIGVGIHVMTELNYDISFDLVACQTIRSTGSKFVSMVISDLSHTNAFSYVMEIQGMLYGPEAYQLVGTESLEIMPSSQYTPSMGFPIGLQRLLPVTRGRLYPHLLDMWSKMSTEDLYGVDATRRYMLTHLKVLVSEASRPMLTEASFEQEPWYFALYLVDAAYTFVIALNSLLNKGMPPEKIYGAVLLEEVRKTTFEGVTGIIGYDDNGDRYGNYELWNVQLVQNGGTRNGSLAAWTPGSNNFTFQDVGRETLTWAGGIISPMAPEVLTACPAGKQYDEGPGLCVSCERNLYSTGVLGGQSTCIPCDAGWKGNGLSAATGCEKCPRGTFRINQDECIPCAAGTFGATEGQSACEECGIGNYSTSEGSTVCEVCGADRRTSHLFKTLSWLEVDGAREYFYLTGATRSEACGCDRGTRVDGNGECIYCAEGTLCKGMGEVHILPGYFADPIVNGELSVFECHGNSLRCPGGLPGQTCAEGRRGITCGECLKGMTPSSGGRCEDCGGTDHGVFTVAVLFALCMLMIMFRVVDATNRGKGSHASVLCGIAAGLALTLVQLLAVLHTLSVEFVDPLESFIDAFSLDFKVIRFDCVSSEGPLQRYIIKICMIFIVVVCIAILHFLSLLCRHGLANRWRIHALVAGIGSILMACYIGVTSTVLEPFQCQGHPNSRWTMLTYPSVICWEGSEHQTMLYLAVIVFLAVPATFFAVCTVVVIQYPSRMSIGDVSFLKTFSFLFVRFRTERYTFVLKQMLRSLGVAMVLIIPNIMVQVFVLEAILLASFAASLGLKPWRVREANILDCVLGAFSLIVVCLVSFFLKEGEKELKGMAWLTLLLVLACFGFSVGVIVYGLYRRFIRRVKPYKFFLCHHKAGAGAYTRLLKMQLLEHPKVARGVFLDSDNLDSLDLLFDHVGNDTEMMVVICSAEIFSRPWCLGEMTTARLHRVSVCRVSLPTCILPDEHLIAGIGNKVEDMHSLAENGISVDEVRITLRWVTETPAVSVPEVVSIHVMSITVERLVFREWRDIWQPDSSLNVGVQLGERITCPVVYDSSNFELEATACILKKLLLPMLAYKSTMVLDMWIGDQVPENAEAMILLCSNCVFDSEAILRILLGVASYQPRILPLVAEMGFRFPDRGFAVGLVRKHSWIGMEEASLLSDVVRNLFRAIAISFMAQQANEAELSLASQSIAKRVTETRSRGTTYYNRRSSVSSSTVSPCDEGSLTKEDPITWETFYA